MEYVDGVDLQEAWASLELWKKLWVAWTLRCHVRQLRNVKLARPEVPGPLDWSQTAVKCVGHYFTSIKAGPFNSYRELTAWFASKYRITLLLENQAQVARNPDPKPYVFDDSMPLVLTHGDISLTNVRLGRDGTVWLIDWGFSGVYPEWFEYAGMMAYDEAHRPGLAPRLWLWLVPFIAVRHHLKQTFMERIELALDHFDRDSFTLLAVFNSLQIFGLSLVVVALTAWMSPRVQDLGMVLVYGLVDVLLPFVFHYGRATSRG